MAATCDDGCEDIDLEVQDSAGGRVAFDLTSDATPYVDVVPKSNDTFKVDLTAMDCGAKACASILRVFKLEKAPSGRSWGSGFFVGPSLFVTNHHVIEDATSIRVILDGEETEAEVLSEDPANDLALMQVKSDMSVLPLSSASSVQVGADAIAFGFPLISVLGQQPRATTGTVNALVGENDDPRMLQIQAPIQPGSSSGPLLNQRGQVIGIVAARRTGYDSGSEEEGVAENIGFAIKIDYLMPLLWQAGWRAPRPTPREIASPANEVPPK